MKKILLLTLSSFLITSIISAQWTQETSFGQVTKDLKAFNNKLYVVGGFTDRDNTSCFWSTYYDGVMYTDQTGLLGGSGLNQLAVYNGELYATGALHMSAVVKASGATWSAVGSFNFSHTGIYANATDLYVGSDFGVVNRKTGTGAFTAMPSLDNNDNILAITEYNGDLIIAGNLNTYNGVALNNIARWDGSAWQPLGTGLSRTVRCMAVYNSELYVGGSFTTAGGQSAPYIAKWNGTSWTSVGGSVTTTGGNGIRDMIVYNNQLIVVGNFSEVGGVSTNNVAVWNGSTWSSLDLVTTAFYANCVEVYNGKLYVGTFDFDDAPLYSRDVNTIGINQLPSEFFELNVYPNPNQGLFTIALDASISSSIAITNALGATVLELDLPTGDQTSIDLSQHPKGIYFIKVTSGNKIGTSKIVVN